MLYYSCFPRHVTMTGYDGVCDSAVCVALQTAAMAIAQSAAAVWEVFEMTQPPMHI